ncbi:hypothetical protein ACAW74_14790 [Fibrella sp. WM1]|nr:hypothetical protein [Fibrella aestuarina]
MQTTTQPSKQPISLNKKRVYGFNQPSGQKLTTGTTMTTITL